MTQMNLCHTYTHIHICIYSQYSWMAMHGPVWGWRWKISRALGGLVLGGLEPLGAQNRYCHICFSFSPHPFWPKQSWKLPCYWTISSNNGADSAECIMRRMPIRHWKQRDSFFTCQTAKRFRHPAASKHRDSCIPKVQQAVLRPALANGHGWVKDGKKSSSLIEITQVWGAG